MSTTTDMKIKISNGRVVASKVMSDGSLNVTVEAQTQEKMEELKETFVLVEASKLSLDSYFMQRKPRSSPELELKKALTEVIKNKPKDFYCPICDPAFSAANEFTYDPEVDCLCTGKSYKWWKKKAREYAPERQSRLGTKSEYIAFLGTLIDDLVHRGWEVDDAWNAVCFSSKLFDQIIQATSTKKILRFYNLIGPAKILEPDQKEQLYDYDYEHDYYYRAGLEVLADIKLLRNPDTKSDNVVGWIVLERPLYDASKYCLEDDEIMMNMYRKK